jgi:hypothetical protein
MARSPGLLLRPRRAQREPSPERAVLPVPSSARAVAPLLVEFGDTGLGPRSDEVLMMICAWATAAVERRVCAGSGSGDVAWVAVSGDAGTAGGRHHRRG